MVKRNDWFEVDRVGLGQLVAARGPEFMVYELVQNAWDQEVTHVEVTLEPVEGRPLVRLAVEDDDPEGFLDLAHSFTLFAESRKKADPSRRGRFNLEEKLVIARAVEATVTSTSGGVRFDQDGRHYLRVRRERGSRVEALVRMTRTELEAVFGRMQSLLPPRGIATVINGEVLTHREPVHEFEARLGTVVADDAGVLRTRKRATTVQLYEPRSGEIAMVYELGIPVVGTGDRWHCNIGQKVPLNTDRDNVPASWLRALRTEVLNATSDRITPEDATSPWVREALSDRDCEEEAVCAAVRQRFGDKVVSYDPSDPAANKLAVSRGFTLVHGGNMSAQEWESVRRAGAILPAGKVTPSPRPFHHDGTPLEAIPEEKWTEGMRYVARYAMLLAREILDVRIRVFYAAEGAWSCVATYGRGRLYLNVARLGRRWFERGVTEDVDALLLHEFAHHYESDHLSSDHHEALCTLGAKLKHLGRLEEEART